MSHHREVPIEIPGEVVDAVRTAAAAVPPHGGELVGVRERGIAYRRHRTAAAVTVTAIAVIVVLAVPAAILVNADQAVPGPVAATSPAPGAVTNAQPAQRLLLDSRSFPAGYWPEEYRALRAVGEVLPDGTIVSRRLPDAERIYEDFLPVGDGGLVVRGAVELPGQERSDDQGPCWSSGYAMRLFFVTADGSVERTHDLPMGCELVGLVHAEPGAVSLLRGERLVEHDLVTGAERPLVDLAERFGPAPTPAFYGGYVPPRQVVFDGARVATVTRDGDADRDCGERRVEVAHLTTGGFTSWPLPRESCIGAVLSLRLSPDGRHVAVAFEHPCTGRCATRVVVLDLADGTVRAEDHRPGPARGMLPGVAWRDHRTLQVAWHLSRAGVEERATKLVELATLRLP